MISLKDADDTIVNALHEYITMYRERIANYPCDREHDAKEYNLAREVLASYGKRFELEDTWK